VVSLNPSISEFLALIGVELVGRDVFSYRPRELLRVRRVGSFVDADVEAIASLDPDLVILYHPVQRGLMERLAGRVRAVVAIPTPTNVDAAVAAFRAVARLVDRDEEGDRVAGVYRDLLRGGSVERDGVLAILYLGGYDVACTASFVADALTRVGLRYVRGLRCVFRLFSEPPDIPAKLYIYESRARQYMDWEVGFLAGREFVVTPNDTLAHYGPSLPLDLQRLVDAVARGERFVSGTSSMVVPSIGDEWYRPYR